ncbi:MULTISPECIES: IDEAL domain-containing protein [unclassified Paenibacillus]|uniref:IDEAL domain-containing protein n=1 Tax=unclassified Paenibacillus TaxID=185978 RepID=UPI002F40257D
MDKMKVAYEAMLGLAAEMVLDEALRTFALNKLNDEIDKSLAAGDESTFHALVQQRNELTSY